jgi:hypothetical protein
MQSISARFVLSSLPTPPSASMKSTASMETTTLDGDIDKYRIHQVDNPCCACTAGGAHSGRHPDPARQALQEARGPGYLKPV